MKLKMLFPIVAWLVVPWLASSVLAQGNLPPAIPNQPASLSLLLGQSGTFTAGITGTPPLACQWQANGTNLPNGIITTVAGNGSFGYTSNHLAVNASLYYPSGVAIDGQGNLFIADTDNNRIRKVDPNGIISTVAGLGPFGYAGNGGPATNAILNHPNGVAVDASGNIFIADTYNSCVRMVNPNGMITTLAGGATAGFGGDGGPATNALLNFPCGVAVDGNGNVFIADTDNNRIRKVDTQGVITTVAGYVTGAGNGGFAGDGRSATNADLNQPRGVAVDAAGDLFIADSSNERVRKVDAKGLITTLAGIGTAGFSGDGGAATNAALADPLGVAVDIYGNVFIADEGNVSIRRVDVNGVIRTVAGNQTSGYGGDGGTAVSTDLNAPEGVTADAFGNIFIADTYNQRIRQVIQQGPLLPLANVSASQAGNYQLLVTNFFGSVTSSVAVLTVLQAPAIVQQPVSQTNVAGSNVTFAVTATGTAPLAYQWQFNGANLTDGGGVTGSATANLGLSQVGAGNVGNYDVLISDAWGSVTSSVVALTVVFPPAITIPPVSVSVNYGGPTTFFPSATGTAPLLYQWQFNGSNLTNGGGVAGVNSSTLGLLQVTDASAGNYTLVVTNAWGSVTSSPAILTIVDSPAINIQPVGKGSAIGGTASFGVSALGLPPLFYQWQFNGVNLTNSSTVSGTTSNNLVLTQIATSNAGSYAVIVTNASGSVTSSVAMLAIDSAPYITTQPVNTTAIPGQNAVLSVVAGGTTPLHYQWQYNGSNITSGRYVQEAGTAELFFDPVNATNGGTYDVIITNAWGSVTSSVVTLTVNSPPSLTRQPVSQIVSNYLNAATFTVGATGAGPLTYQWLYNGKPIANNLISTVAGTNNGSAAFGGDGGPATKANLNHPSGVALDAAGNLFIADTYNYRIRKINTNGIITTVAGNGYSGYSGNGNVATNSSLYEPFGVAVDSDDSLYIADTDNMRVRLVVYDSLITVAGSGSEGYAGDGGLAYAAWLFYPSGVAVDAGDNIYIADTYNYRIRKVDVNDVITTVAGNGKSGFGGDGGAATNAEISYPGGVAVDALGNVYIADTDNNRIRKVGTNGIITTVAGNGAGGYVGNSGVATNADLYRPSGVTVDGYGQIFIADTFNQRIRKVDLNGIITTLAGNGTQGYTSDGVTATNTALDEPAGVAVDAAGNVYIADTVNNRIRKVTPQGPAYTLTNAGLTNAGNYQVIVSSAYGSVTSSVASLTVDLPPLITQQPTNQVVINGGNTSFSAIPTGSTPLFYQWQCNGTNLTAGFNQLQQGSVVSVYLNQVSAANAGNYSVIFTNAYGSVTSSVASLTITYPPAITVPPASQSVVAGSNTVFSVAATGTGPLDYQWLFNGVNLTDGGNLAGSSTPNLQFTGVANANAGAYSVVVASTWGSVTSSVATLTVVYTPGITNQPASVEVLPGNPAAFTVTATGTPPLTYQWQFNGTNLTDGGLVTGSTTTNLLLAQANTTNAGLYDVVIANAWGSVTSSVVSLTLVYPPAITNQPVSQTVVAVNSNSAVFSVAATGTAPLAWQWLFNGTNLTDGGEVSGSAGPNLLLSPVTGNDAGNYSVIITNAWGSVTSRVATLTVLLPPVITNQPLSTTTTNGGSVTFSAGATGTPVLAWQWQLNGSNLPNGLISSIAGSGSGGGFSGDGGPATSAGLNYPYAVAVDGQGNRFIVDQENTRIRKVDVHGLITTCAGNGGKGYSGDGGPATNATLENPYGVAVDGAGNLFIADTQNQRVRKVNTNGIITTVAGNGRAVYSGDGGAATNAGLFFPYGVAVDAGGNLFIADRSSERVRKVDTNGIIMTVAGNGTNGFSGDGGAATKAELGSPTGVAVDGGGNLYIVDYGNQRIRKVDTNGVITTFAGSNGTGYSGDGGAATKASLNNPSGVSVDPQGNVFIADTFNLRVRKVDVRGIITTVAGNGGSGLNGDGGPATKATLYNPYGVATDASGNLYIADALNERVREVGLQGPVLNLANVSVSNAGNYQAVVTNLYGSATSSVAVLTLLLPPALSQPPASQSVVIGSNATFTVTATGTSPLAYQWQFNGGNVAGANYLGTNSPSLTVLGTTAWSAGNYNVIITNAYGSVTSSVATLTITYPPAITTQPASLVVSNGSPASFTVGVAGTGPFTYQWQLNGTNLPNNLISTVAGNGTDNFHGDGGAATNAGLNYPYGLAVDGTGNLYIADDFNFRVRKVNTNGIISTVAGNGNEGFNGNGLVATNSSLYQGALSYYPAGGVAVDAGGNLFIADMYNQRLRVETYNLLLTVAGNGTTGYSGDGGDAYNAALNRPAGVAIDASGNIYIADTYNSRIRKVDVNDIITTVAGNGNIGVAGDGGNATNAYLYNPTGVAVDNAGDLFIADMGNNRIRKVDAHGIITTVAGNAFAAYAGDGGAATNASLSSPYGVAVDAYGNLFIADSENQRIRMVNASGIITTVAGGGSGYVVDGIAATNAILSRPNGVAVDAAGGLYIADTYHYRIRKVTPQGPVLTVTHAGIGNAGNYQVVITSTSGSVTSTVATLTVDVGPVITQSPASLNIVSGGNATFSVIATGTSPLAYQWEFNGANLASQTNQTLLLPAVGTASAGPYQVLVTNQFGSATSSVASLTVGQPQISGVTGGNGGVTLSLLTGANASSRLLAATNLVPPVIWLPLYTNVPGPSGVWQFTDTNTQPMRFYRTVTP